MVSVLISQCVYISTNTLDDSWMANAQKCGGCWHFSCMLIECSDAHLAWTLATALAISSYFVVYFFFHWTYFGCGCAQLSHLWYGIRILALSSSEYFTIFRFAKLLCKCKAIHRSSYHLVVTRVHCYHDVECVSNVKFVLSKSTASSTP